MKRYSKTERGGGLFSAIEHEQAVAAKSTGILKLRDVIPWESFRPLLEDDVFWQEASRRLFDPSELHRYLPTTTIRRS